VARARQALSSVGEGSVLIVGDTSRSLADRQFLAELQERWSFCPLESRGIVSAYRLATRGSPCAPQGGS
jgi:hypothetical protein